MGKVVDIKKTKNKKLFLVLAVLFLATAALVYINLVHSAYSKILSLDKSSIMSLEESTYIFGKTSEGIVACGQDGLTVINKNGEILWKYSLSVNNPMLSCAGAYALYTDIGGNDSFLVSGGNEVYHHKSPYRITTAKVNKSGYLTVVSKERGYKSQVAVISPTGTEVYVWHSAKYYIVDAICDNSCRGMFVSVLNSDSSDSMYKLLYFSFKDTEPKSLETGGDNLIASLECYGNNVIGIGDMGAYGFDKNGKRLFEIDYGGRALQEYSIGSSFLALGLTKGSVDGYYTGSILEVYNFNGNLNGTYEISDEITFLDTDNNKVLVNSEDGAYILSGSCHLYGNLTFENEVREGLIFGEGKKLMLVNGSSVNIYNSK